MAAKYRKFWITFGVIAAIVIAAVVAVRLILTPERLMAIVLPRVERMVDADVTIGGIGINFPFGFGVDITDLRFEKTLPDSTELSFSSRTVTVRAPLLSLLRRKPEITSAAVRGGSVTLVNAAKAREIGLVELESQFAMKPAGDRFDIGIKARVDSILVSQPGRPPAIALEKVGFDGALETDLGFSKLAVRDGQVRWDDLVSVKIAGEVTDVKTAPRLNFTLEGDERALVPVLAKIKAFRFEELSRTPARAPKPQAAQPPPELTAGSLAFSARIEGLAREPLGMHIAFEAALEDASIAAGELVSIGALTAHLKGSGSASAWQSLMPSAANPLTPENIALSWRSIELEGTIEISGGAFVLKNTGAESAGTGAGEAAGSELPAPLKISALRARAEIAGSDLERIAGEFRLGGSPFTFSGSLGNIMPAAAELTLIAQQLARAGDPQPIADLGPYLDGMVNSPVVRIEAHGRSFDARPYEKPLSSAKKEPAPVPPAPAATSPAASGAAAILFLKNTAFAATLDSVIAREAILTGVEAKGTVRDGRIRIDPVTFAYAGGKGSAEVESNVRRPARVESAIGVSLDGIEAGQALGRLFALGSFVEGRFSIDAKANIATGEKLDPLMSLTAAGSALSQKGSVNFERFLGGLSTIQNFDVTPLTSFNFNEWKGNFLIQNGRFITEDWKINSSSGAWAIRGSFGLDGSLDYLVHAVIPPAVQQRMKNIDAYKSALDLMRDQDGNLILDIRVKGAAKHPSAMLDLTKAKSKAQDKVIEGLKKLIR